MQLTHSYLCLSVSAYVGLHLLGSASASVTAEEQPVLQKGIRGNGAAWKKEVRSPFAAVLGRKVRESSFIS